MGRGYQGGGGCNRGAGTKEAGALGGETTAASGSPSPHRPTLSPIHSVTLSYPPYSKPHFSQLHNDAIELGVLEAISSAIIKLCDPKKWMGKSPHHTHTPERLPLYPSPPLCFDLPHRWPQGSGSHPLRLPAEFPPTNPSTRPRSPVAAWEGEGCPWARVPTTERPTPMPSECQRLLLQLREKQRCLKTQNLTWILCGPIPAAGSPLAGQIPAVAAAGKAGRRRAPALPVAL